MSHAVDPDLQTRVESAPAGGGFPEDAIADAAAWPSVPLCATDATVPEVLGKYRIDCRLASGGMGSIYLARSGDAQGGEPVAVKSIHGHLAVNPAFVAMFIDEARITSQIAHPSVCKVHEYGLHAQQPYLVMEFIVGENLAVIKRAAARLNRNPDKAATAALCSFESFVVAVTAAICDGLHAAHELCDAQGGSLGVVHRDVSPANLFVTYDGGVRVVDFGVAKAAGRAHETVSGVVKGKFAYMSPEQMAGHDTDRRTDIWSVGLVLVELLTGQRVFGRATEAATVHAVLHEDAPSLESLAPGTSPRLASIVARCLAPRAAQRYASAADLAQDLRTYLDQQAVVVGAGDIAAWMSALFPAGLERKHELLERARTLGDQRRRPSKLRRAALGLAALSALGLIATLIGSAAMRSDRDAGTPGPVSAATLRARISNAAAPPMPPPVSAPVAPASSQPVEPAVPAVAPSAQRAQTTAARAPVGTRAAERGRGIVNLATPGGWAEVFVRGKRLGTAPGRYELPAGAHRLELKPFGKAPSRYVAITVRASDTTRVSVPLTTSAAHAR